MDDMLPSTELNEVRSFSCLQFLSTSEGWKPSVFEPGYSESSRQQFRYQRPFVGVLVGSLSKIVHDECDASFEESRTRITSRIGSSEEKAFQLRF